MDEQGGLGAVEVVDAAAVGDKAKLLEFVHEILQRRVDDVV